MMTVAFKRDMNHNYLILPKCCSSYQIMMSAENEIRGLLPSNLRVMDGEEKIFYDISSMQNYIRIFERREMGTEDLQNLFYSWKETVEEAERFLLNPAFILCDPEYVYYSLTEGKPKWIFYPAEEESVTPEGLTALAEFILEKVNHKDADAVDVAYQFYRSVKEGTFLLPGMIKTIEKIKVRVIEKVPGDCDEQISLEENTRLVERMDEVEEKEEEDVLDKIGKFFRGLFPGKKEKDNKDSGRKSLINEERHIASCKVKTFPKEDFESGAYAKTRLISEGGMEKRELTNSVTKEKYSLASLPVVVGKMKEMVDICIDDDSVSRLHARFFESEGRLCIEDLNSTNGCSVNEIPLENNEKVFLSPGDRIVLGAVHFIYN